MAQRALAYGVVCVGLITTATAMAALHPHEYVYFNALVDTKTPGALGERYEMDYWQVAHLQLMDRLLARYPDSDLRVWINNVNRQILPQSDNDRIPILESMYAADFYLWSPKRRHPARAGSHLHPLIEVEFMPDQPLIHSVRAYDSPIALIYGKDAAAYHAAYDDVAANGDPLARSDFDIYAYDGALYYLSADCPPPPPNRADLRIFLHIIPANLADLPAAREYGFENRDFRLGRHAAFFDGKCMHRQPLPDYAIARVSTGEFVSGAGDLWRAEFPALP